MRKFLLISVVASLGFGLLGCGGDGSQLGTTGTLSFNLVDAPLPDVQELNITFDRVEAHLDGQWIEIAEPGIRLNLLDLTREAAPLGSAGVPLGTYTQVRLFVSDVQVVDDQGTHDVTVPSGLQTGIKVNIGATVTGGDITTILLDFNVEKSLRRQGNGQYLLQPVILAVLEVLSGTVTGAVELLDEPVHGALITATYTEGDNYELGTEVNTSTTDAQGDFKVWALLEGTYQITVSYTDPDTSVEYSAVVDDVVVVRQTDVSLGVIVLE